MEAKALSAVGVVAALTLAGPAEPGRASGMCNAEESMVACRPELQEPADLRDLEVEKAPAAPPVAAVLTNTTLQVAQMISTLPQYIDQNYSTVWSTPLPLMAQVA